MHFLHSPVCHFSSPLPLFIFFFLSTFSLFSYRSFALPALWWQIANCTLHKGFTCTTTTLLTVLIKSEGGKTLSSHWILVAGRITKPFPTDLTGSQKEWEENSKNWVIFLFPIPLRGQSFLLSKLVFDIFFCCYKLNCIPPHCMLKCERPLHVRRSLYLEIGYLKWCAVLTCSVVSDSAIPWTAARQAPLSMGILQARILEWVAMPSSRGSSRPRDRTQVSRIAGRFFTIWVIRGAHLKQ